MLHYIPKMSYSYAPSCFLLVVTLIGNIQPMWSPLNFTAPTITTIQNKTLNAGLSCGQGSTCPKNATSNIDTVGSYSVRVDSFLRSSSVLYGLIGQSTPTDVNQQCYNHLQSVYEGIHKRDIWAMKSKWEFVFYNCNFKCYLKLNTNQRIIIHEYYINILVLDASATAQSGFVWGNNYWMGSRKQCESIQEKKHITLSNRFERNMKPNLVDAPAQFPVDYRMVYAEHRSPWQIEVEFLITAVWNYNAFHLTFNL